MSLKNAALKKCSCRTFGFHLFHCRMMYGLCRQNNWHFNSLYKSNQNLAAFLKAICVLKIDITLWHCKQVQKLIYSERVFLYYFKIISAVFEVQSDFCWRKRVTNKWTCKGDYFTQIVLVFKRIVQKMCLDCYSS